ncbi:DNA-binding CsgD family transcriptional regulator [Rhizobium azibense]|nr:DNA-binding CsgD family transcriptional regulator [Rhizobium azibense]
MPDCTFASKKSFGFRPVATAHTPPGWKGFGTEYVVRVYGDLTISRRSTRPRRCVWRRLRARRRDRDAALREAVRLAFRELQSQRPLNIAPKQAWAVALGEDAAGVPLYCWVQLEDGKALISFDDDEAVARRIASAREDFSLSPVQTRLARLIVDGQDLAAASDLLGVSVNTLRTQLQRIFDKTGVRSQATLVRALLSAEAPTK